VRSQSLSSVTMGPSSEDKLDCAPLDLVSFTALAGLVPANRVADVFLAYCAAVEARETRLAAELQTTSVGAIGSELTGVFPGEPGSEVSVGSSASSSRARRRARWRANKAKRLRSASEVTYRCETTSGDVSDGEGYCYLAVVPLPYVDVAKGKLGAEPTFRDLLSAPSEWFAADLSRARVNRVVPGKYHICASGMVPLVGCLASVVQKCGRFFPASSLGGRGVFRAVQSEAMLSRAPSLSDVCGSTVVASAPVTGLRLREGEVTLRSILRPLHASWGAEVQLAYDRLSTVEIALSECAWSVAVRGSLARQLSNIPGVQADAGRRAWALAKLRSVLSALELLFSLRASNSEYVATSLEVAMYRV